MCSAVGHQQHGRVGRRPWQTPLRAAPQVLCTRLSRSQTPMLSPSARRAARAMAPLTSEGSSSQLLALTSPASNIVCGCQSYIKHICMPALTTQTSQLLVRSRNPFPPPSRLQADVVSLAADM